MMNAAENGADDTGNENDNETKPSDPAITQASPEAAKQADTTEERRPRRRGFAAMDRTRVKEIASKGGKAAHAAGTAHQFSSDEARVAGRKGGMAPHVRRGGVRRRSNGDTTQPQSDLDQNHTDSH